MSSGESVAENVIGAGNQVAVLVPCYNDQHAVAKVGADFRGAARGSGLCRRQQFNRPHRRGRALRAPGKERRGPENMRELVRTNDAVLITAIEALLSGAQIEHMVVDRNMSVLEGSIGIFPRRILVADSQIDDARRLLEQAGFSGEISHDGR
jgi:hypothetical protein